MSLPRQVLPGSTYLVTRRCTQRQFLLKPTRLTCQIFAYCLAADGRSFLGARAILAQDPYDAPRSSEPRRTLSPRIAAKNTWARIEALRRVKAFIERYRVAYCQWKAGVRDVVFPAGTYGMRVQHGVACAPP
jgi:hypothetical protein